MFFQPFENLNQKLDQVDTKVSILSSFRSEFSEWNEVFELMNEIKEELKIVRYPTLNEKNEAWQKLYRLREKAYTEREKDFKYISKGHLDELHSKLAGLRYSALEDFIVSNLTFGEMKVTKEEMRQRGQELNEAAKYFSSVKQEMSREDKAEIHERILDIRESHDRFWEEIKQHSNELEQIKYEKQKAWEERQERKRQAKERVENNLEKNKGKLENAKDALERFEKQKANLEEKIESAYSDNYREKHEEWLDEVNEKISRVEEQIERLEGWIREDEQKLDFWID